MIQDISWGALNYKYVFVIFVIVLFVLWYRYYKTRRAITLLAGSWASDLIDNFSMVRLFFKSLLQALAVLFLCGALLRPQGKAYEEIVAQQGRDVYCALDVSRSMLAGDVGADRLTCAKEKIKQIVSQLKCERIGLILFSGSAHIMCPLTADVSAFLSFLNQVDVETISSGTTALDGAIHKALMAFETVPTIKNKLLVLFTDGEDFSTELDEVKKRAQEQGLYIVAFGVGSLEGAPIPVFDHFGNPAGHQRDERGAVVISQLNEVTLRSLVQDVGGEYIRVTENNSDVQAVIEKVQSFEKETLEDTQIKRFDEKYPYCVLVSVLCLIIEWCL